MTKDERKFMLSSGKECRTCLEEIKAMLSEDLSESFNALKELGVLIRFDDDENEVTRCVIEEWIDYKNENFYDSAALLLRNRIFAMSEEIDKLCLLKPYSFVLENEDNEHVAELYVVDDDLNIIGGDIMEGWDKDLDAFFSKLMEE